MANNKITQYFIFIINFAYLIFNIYYLYFQIFKKVLLIERKNNIMKSFKNIDLFSMNLMRNSFQNISFYLDSKYNSYTSKSKKIYSQKTIELNKKKVIRLFSTTNDEGFYGKIYKNI